jgi:predicted phosphodiesterase
VVTHHAPDVKIVTSKFSNLETCFGTDVIKDLKKENIILWVYGHTHTNRSWKVDGVQLICNQLGYPSEHTGYDNSLTYKVN